MNGLENKLGIMLYGPPGTGKTGVIQAIANYTGRSIIMINLSIIKDSKMLDEVFKGRDKKDYIFVFEEIDCMGDIVMKRSNAPSPTKDTTTETMMEMVTAVASISSGGKSNMKDKAVNGKLELGHILSKIDGIESNEDAIYIATTNRIDVLDDALIRPGRFGFKLELSYCDRDMLTDIISMILGLNESNRTYLYEHIPDKAINNIKPVEIIQQCQIENDLERIIKYLKKF
jgi:ATP-dependent 26S proteasome regulatory subunit